MSSFSNENRMFFNARKTPLTSPLGPSAVSSGPMGQGGKQGGVIACMNHLHNVLELCMNGSFFGGVQRRSNFRKYDFCNWLVRINL